MGLTLVTAPSVEPVSLDDAKLYLRIDGTDEDAVIGDLIKAARTVVEQKGRLALITQTWDYTLDAWPDVIRIPIGPVQSVVSVTYVDSNGTTQTLDPAEYQVDNSQNPARITPAYGRVWPVARVQPNSIAVRFVAGFGDTTADIPRDLRQALLLLLGHFYENREAVTVGSVTEVPMTVNFLILPRKVWA